MAARSDGLWTPCGGAHLIIAKCSVVVSCSLIFVNTPEFVIVCECFVMSTRVFESWVEYLANARSMRAPRVLGGDAPARVSGSGTMQQVIIFQPCHVKADGNAIVERRCGHMFLVVVLQSMQRCEAHRHN